MSSSGELLRLETTGRVSGKPHDVLVRFIAVDGKIIVFPQNRGNQDWVKNLRVNPSVGVFGAGKKMTGMARPKQIEGLKDPLLKIFTRKYGEAEVRKRYWGQHEFFEIVITSQSSAQDYTDLWYADIEAAFDGVAEDYDRHILGNEMNLWLRNRSIERLLRLFHPGDVILEIGCGTGTETITLARHGIKVIASDISSKMLAVLQRKVDKERLEGVVVPVHSRPYELKDKLGSIGFHQIDGAYSTYGAINTEPRLQVLFKDLRDIIKPGGSLLLGVWNKYCLYELLGYSFRLRPRMAVARLRNPVPVGRSRFCIAAMAYSVGSLNKLLSGQFELRKVYGVEILLPPSNLVKYLPPKALRGVVDRMEIGIEGRYPWNRLGDHFLAVYSRIGRP
ncbi:MAG: nitroreductase/quinone reductase family protein [Thaumarchaeota archaeon]|nr:nitroreductase/quinone reductase family protein [Nitrososphaerota archaeon]